MWRGLFRRHFHPHPETHHHPRHQPQDQVDAINLQFDLIMKSRVSYVNILRSQQMLEDMFRRITVHERIMINNFTVHTKRFQMDDSKMFIKFIEEGSENTPIYIFISKHFKYVVYFIKLNGSPFVIIADSPEECFSKFEQSIISLLGKRF